MNKYRRIAKIQFEGQTYQYYRNIKNRKLAFLKFDENSETYHYPTIEELIKLAYCFKNELYFSSFRNYKSKRNIRHKLYRFAPKVLIGGALLTTSLFLSNIANDLNLDFDFLKNVVDSQNDETNDISFDNENYKSMPSIDESEIEKGNLSQPVVKDSDSTTNGKSYIIQHNSSFFDLDEDIDDRVIDSNDYLNGSDSTLVMVYNTEAFKEFGIRTDYSYKDMEKIIDKSIRIDDEYKDIIKDFCKTMNEFYDDLDNTIFYNNLKMLKIVRDSSKLGSRDVVACYDSKENVIYVSETAVFEEDTIDMVILRHELGHLYTESRFVSGDNMFLCNYANNQDEGIYIKEALNTILTTEPFLSRYSDETENNMGYAMITNYLRTLIEIMPNFKVQQMTWGNYSFFANRLDEAFDCNIDAYTLISLLELQCNEYYGKGIIGDSEDYKEIYEYLGIAYKNYFEENNISDDSIQNFVDTLNLKLEQGVDDTSLIYSDSAIAEIQGDAYVKGL